MFRPFFSQKNRDQKRVWGSLSYDCMLYLICIMYFVFSKYMYWTKLCHFSWRKFNIKISIKKKYRENTRRVRGFTEINVEPLGPSSSPLYQIGKGYGIGGRRGLNWPYYVNFYLKVAHLQTYIYLNIFSICGCQGHDKNLKFQLELGEKNISNW